MRASTCLRGPMVRPTILHLAVGATPVSNLADLTLGMTLLRAHNLSLSARYAFQVGPGFMSHTGSLKRQQVF